MHHNGGKFGVKDVGGRQHACACRVCTGHALMMNCIFLLSGVLDDECKGFNWIPLCGIIYSMKSTLHARPDCMNIVFKKNRKKLNGNLVNRANMVS